MPARSVAPTVAPTHAAPAAAPRAAAPAPQRRGRVASVVHGTRTGLALWWAHDGPRLGAAVAYYSIFALAPVLVIAITVAGAVFGEEAARGHVVTQLAGLVGAPAAENIEAMIASAWTSEGNGLAATLGIATLLVAATGVFAELRYALNTMFDVEAEQALSGLVRARLVAFALVLAFGFLLIVSLMFSAVMAALSQWLSLRYPAAAPLLTATDLAVSLTILAGAFAVILRGLPARRPSWLATVIGAVTCALLFTLGKSLVALYLVRAGVATSFGAAGSFVVVIFWVFYSTQVLLIGAAVGQQIAVARGRGKGALKADATRDHAPLPRSG